MRVYIVESRDPLMNTVQGVFSDVVAAEKYAAKLRKELEEENNYTAVVVCDYRLQDK